MHRLNIRLIRIIIIIIIGSLPDLVLPRLPEMSSVELACLRIARHASFLSLSLAFLSSMCSQSSVALGARPSDSELAARFTSRPPTRRARSLMVGGLNRASVMLRLRLCACSVVPLRFRLCIVCAQHTPTSVSDRTQASARWTSMSHWQVRWTSMQ
eukprot:2918053-Rhodomonas_salina.2